MTREILFDPLVIERYLKNYREQIEFAIFEGRCVLISEKTKNKYLKLIYDNLSSISERQRAVLMMYANGYTQEEMSRLLNISRGSVRNYLKRAITNMKKISDINKIIKK